VEWAKRLRTGWLKKVGFSAAALPALALASLAGVPFTAGAVTRWRLYGALLAGAKPSLFISLWVADALLAGGLWLTWNAIWRQARLSHSRPPAWAAMTFLALGTIVLGLAPRLLTGHLGLALAPRPGVSVWGLGIVSFLPWLVGAWLARVVEGADFPLQHLRRTLKLDVAFGAADWLGQKGVTALNWLAQVGEGEGWWGWALIILALAALYLSVR
jgi:hypothetical protein